MGEGEVTCTLTPGSVVRFFFSFAASASTTKIQVMVMVVFESARKWKYPQNTLPWQGQIEGDWRAVCMGCPHS